MKLDWQMEGTVAYKDSAIRAIQGTWPDLTHAQANARAESVVAEFLRKRKVHSVSVTVSAGTGSVRSLIIHTQSK